MAYFLIPEKVEVVIAQQHIESQQVPQSVWMPELPGAFEAVLKLAVEGFD